MRRTAQAHGRGNAPRQHARRGDVLQPFFYCRTSRRGDGRMTSSMGTGNAGDPSPVAQKGDTTTDAAHLPRLAEIRQPPRAPAAHQGERELFRTTEYTKGEA